MDAFFARNRLSAYLDGELPSGEAREVEDALAQSPELRAELAELQSAIALLRQGGPVPAPKGFARRLDAAIAREPMRVGWRRHLYGFRIEAGMLAAAAAIVLVFAAQKKDDSEVDPVGPPGVDVAGVAGGEATAGGDPGAGGDPEADLAAGDGPEASLAAGGSEAGGDNAPNADAVAMGPDADGVLGDESFARKVGTSDRALTEKARAEKIAAKNQSLAPSTGGSRPSKGGYEKEPYSPAWEQASEAPERAPTVQSVAPFQFRLTTHGETGLRDLAALAASLGGSLTDSRGKPIAPYLMESGETKTVKLLLPSTTAGSVASRLTEYGSIEIINVSERTLYATGATVPVVIEITAP